MDELIGIASTNSQIQYFCEKYEILVGLHYHFRASYVLISFLKPHPSSTCPYTLQNSLLSKPHPLVYIVCVLT